MIVAVPVWLIMKYMGNKRVVWKERDLEGRTSIRKAQRLHMAEKDERIAALYKMMNTISSQ